MQPTAIPTHSQKFAASEWRPHGPLGPEDALHFLHIPKTAGRSVRVVLESNFDLDVICPGTVLPDVYGLPATESCRWRLFCGHYGRYIHSLLDRKPVEITFLRDPVGRSISHYLDLQTRKDTWLYEYVNTHTFNEFVLDPVVGTELMNLQTRYLALDDIQRDYFDRSELREKDLPALIRRYTDPAMLGIALANLGEMAFVGLQERFEESLQLLAATFGWRPPREAPRRNTTTSPFDPASISDRAMARLREITALDQELYRVAASRFDAIMRQLTPEARQAAYAEAMRARPRVRRLSLGFDKAILGRGWHARERGTDGWSRWTGPDNVASIDLPLDTTLPMRLRFKASAVARDIVEEASILLNGQQLRFRSWQLSVPPTSTRVFDVPLPPDVLGACPAFARIEFRVPRTAMRSGQAGDSQDRRSLGLYFHWLEIISDCR